MIWCFIYWLHLIQQMEMTCQEYNSSSVKWGVTSSVKWGVTLLNVSRVIVRVLSHTMSHQTPFTQQQSINLSFHSIVIASYRKNMTWYNVWLLWLLVPPDLCGCGEPELANEQVAMQVMYSKLTFIVPIIYCNFKNNNNNNKIS